MSDPFIVKRNEAPKNVFNPLNEDLVFRLRNDKNEHVEYVLPFFKASTFPTYIADRLIERVIDAIVNDRNLKYPDREKIREEVVR